MPKTKTTIYVDSDVLRAIRVQAARRGLRDSEVIEEALRKQTLLGVFERAASRIDMDPDEAERLAVELVREARAERRAG